MAHSDPTNRPLLLYDGDCTFCRYCIDYAASATGDAIRYAPYQHELDHYPFLDEQQCQAAIQFIHDHRHFSGAQAAFQVLAVGADRGIWMWLYRWLPLFALISEGSYKLIARQRGAAHRVCRLLFGHTWRPLEYRLLSWLFVRCFALLCLAAFVSFAFQADGLAGSNGIMPVADFFARVRQTYPGNGWWLFPSLFWIHPGDALVHTVTGAGMLFSVLLLLNRLPRLSVLMIYACYLSIVNGVQVFFNYQWDVMLLEACLMTLILLQWQAAGVWLMRWFLFRFMWLGGLVKILSGDPAWPNLTALGYHFETQPLPTLFAWYAHQSPDIFLKAGVATTLVIELVIVFAVLLPRNIRLLGGLAIVALQLVIFITGNYNFFNLLTLALCLLVLDDQRLRHWLGRIRLPQPAITPKRSAGSVSAIGVTAAIVLAGALDISRTLDLPRPENLVASLSRSLGPWHLVNHYGPFAVMTRTRREIIIEGSDNGRHWRSYPFRYKPQTLDQAPRWATPHQPRLDWQMWFAALGNVQRNLWFQALVLRLLQGSPAVLDLFAANPFPDAPPRFIRALLYQYRFTNNPERGQNNHWWKREFAGLYLPPVQLRNFARDR